MLFTPFLLFFAVAGQKPALANGDFEAAKSTEGWTLTPTDLPAGLQVRPDDRVHHGGRQSLAVSSPSATTFNLNQQVYLPVGSLWRASLWFRVEGLKTAAPRLRIETPAGDQGEQSVDLNNGDWQAAHVLFRVPSPGSIRMRLIAFENSAGKVWLDDARLEPVDEPDDLQDVTVTRERWSDRPIDLKQGGQFIEPLCRLTSSMIAQQVDDTSFEEEPPWRPSYKRAIDKPYRPWYPDGAVHLAKYSFDTENAFNGKRSQKIELPVAHAWAGISQDGFYLDTGRRYKLRLHLRGEGAGKVRASLHGGGTMLTGQVSLGTASPEWKPAEVLLRPNKASTNATLTIEFEGPGTLWLDRVSLIEDTAVLGVWRPDVVQALNALNPGVIRFGGSTLEVFEWDKCIGPWDKRAPYATEPWGGLDPNFIGVEEFVQLCRQVHAEPLICVRWTGKTPQDAEAEVEYFNGAPDTKWGHVRAANGHRDPYGVKYWQIGNEIGGGAYDGSVKAFAEAMRQADPKIKVLSSFPSADTLKLGGGYLDYLCPHHYDAGDLVGEEASFTSLRDQIARYANGKDVRIAVTEWNTTAGQMGLTRGMLLTLGNALSCSRYQNLMHRYSSLVEIAIRSNLSDSFGSGVIQPGPGWLYRSPEYYSQSLYQRAAGTYPLKILRTGDTPDHLQEPDLSATLTNDGKTLRIYAVNSTARTERARLHLQNQAIGAEGIRVSRLGDREAQALDSEVMNSHDDPNRVDISVKMVPATGDAFVYNFEPFTLTLLEVSLR
jgi:alpha-N-arabinofuranosidase